MSWNRRFHSWQEAITVLPYWALFRRPMLGGTRLNELRGTLDALREQGLDIEPVQIGLHLEHAHEGWDAEEWNKFAKYLNLQNPDFLVCTDSPDTRLLMLLHHREWVERVGMYWEIRPR